ncbi:MAG TPA: KTSC domain-containing protein [Sphingomicrobium sp.]|nr:KTSC domain-containing protein [Sphingomicrobium sp.]
MPSTVIRSFDFRPERRELEITFTTGRRYLYSNVPEDAVGKFRAAFSKGSHFNRHIRDRFPCRELDPIT